MLYADLNSVEHTSLVSLGKEYTLRVMEIGKVHGQDIVERRPRNVSHRQSILHDSERKTYRRREQDVP
jgi:hypothetical protein